MNASSRRGHACVTASQVAEICCVSVRTVRRWMNDGDLHFLKLGRAVRVHEDDLEAFLATRRR